MRKRSIYVAGLAILSIAAAGAVYVNGRGDAAPVAYNTAKAERGELQTAVAASGTLGAVVTVQVGSQVSGQITVLHVDFNSEVTAGQVIAHIDPENFAARVREAKAQLSVAESNVILQEAAIDRAQSELSNAQAGLTAATAQSRDATIELEDAELALDRNQELFQRGVVATSQVDKSKVAHDKAEIKLQSANSQIQGQKSLIGSRQASVRMAEAQLMTALAQVEQRQAGLHYAEVDLEHTIIRSPVDGVVIKRDVDIGQTVAASLQAPVLFTIAQDLRRMQVEVNVDEADIGQVQSGHRATFTVDAFPRRTFNGAVSQIRKSPRIQQNVVTYTVVVSANNPDQALLPGMTANVRLIVAERTGALKIANSALRFRPEGKTTPRASPTRAVAQTRGTGGGRLNLENLTRELELSEEQQSQLQTVLADSRQRTDRGRRGGARTGRGRGGEAVGGGERNPDAAQAQRQRREARLQEIITSILTTEQREKFQALQAGADAGRRARVWVLDGDGQPKPVDVKIGISDGTFTEVVGGELEGGQLVITGINDATSRGSSSRFTGFRL